MPTLCQLTYDGVAAGKKFLGHHHSFAAAQGLSETQVIGLLFTHLMEGAVEWYATEVGGNPPADWAEIIDNFTALFGEVTLLSRLLQSYPP